MEAQNLEINKNVAQNPHSTSQKDATKKQARSVYTISATQTKKVTVSRPPIDNKQPNRPEGNTNRKIDDKSVGNCKRNMPIKMCL